MLDQKEQIQKKRISWTPQEDKLLMQFVQKFQDDQLAWKKISASLKKKGYNRNTKACRERYFNHLDDSFNKSDLTDTEIDELFQLVKIYGNKWTCIAEEMNNRTDQDIKNKFYAHVKKIFRRLLKSTFKTSSSSNITSQIQPILISSIFCKNDDDDDSKLIQIDSEMKELFTNLIKKHKQIRVGELLDLETISQVRTIKNYLENQNQIYLQSKITKKENKNKKKCKKYKFQFNKDEQAKIILRISKKLNIFQTNKLLQSNNPEFYQCLDQDQSIQYNAYFKAVDSLPSNTISGINQFASNIPFYWCQPCNQQNTDQGLSDGLVSNLNLIENPLHGFGFWQSERINMEV